MGSNNLKNFLDIFKCDLTKNLVSDGSVRSLGYIALVRIVIKLWEISLRHQVQQHLSSDPNNTTFVLEFLIFREKYENKINETVSTLNLPVCFKQKLEQTICLIGNEIGRFYGSLSEANPTSVHLKNFNVYLNNLCWTQEGTIDRISTALNVIENSNNDISMQGKYVLACDFCLEDKIRELYEYIPTQTILTFFENASRHVTPRNDRDPCWTYDKYMPHCLVTFWTAYIGKEKAIPGASNNVPPVAYLLSYAIARGKEVAVQYIWENLADETLKKGAGNWAIFTLIKKPDNLKVLLFFLKQVSHVDSKVLFSSVGYKILRALSSGCRKVFQSAAKYTLGLIRELNVEEALKTVILCWYNDVLGLNHYKSLWTNLTFHFKRTIGRDFFEICGNILYDCDILTEKQDAKTMKMLLRMSYSEDKKHILIHDFRGERTCNSLILNGNLDLLDLFFNEIFCTESEKIQFKIDYFARKGIEMCTDLVLASKFEILNEFLTMFCAADEIDEFKKNLPYADNAVILVRLCARYEGRRRMKYLDKFLKYCFNNDEFHAASCKKFVVDFQEEVKQLCAKLLLN